MVHRGVAEAYARLLVHVEVHIVDAAVLEQVSRPRAALAIHERTAVRAEPHRDALFGQDRAHAYFFQNSTGVISPSRWNMPSESVHSQSKLFGGSPR